jgi:hypothetical protein
VRHFGFAASKNGVFKAKTAKTSQSPSFFQTGIIPAD